MSASSLLVPAAGILTQPILAQALGVAGRGELAAALAPAALAVAVATLGLPEALTYYLAKHPRATRPALMWATLISGGLGGACLLGTLGTLPFLSTGDPELGSLILLATALTIPALVVGALRGAACGRQMWNAVAAERLANSALRIVLIVALWLVGELTVVTAVVVTSLSPILSGVAYWRLLVRPAEDGTETSKSVMLHQLLSFGSRMWLGAVASMLLARIGQILMAPLASVEQLGLYSVANTISDVPLIVALAIQGALFGLNSKSKDAIQLTSTTRLTLLVGFVGCAMLGGTLPFWMVPLFGAGFENAVIPTLMLMLSALLCIPGLMAATGVSAWGRPGLRSVGIGITLVINIIAFIILVPTFGVIGACITSIISNIVMTGFMVVVASRVMEVSALDFLIVRIGDVRRVWRECVNLVARMRCRDVKS